MNTYSDSKGNRYTTEQINRKSDKSAKLLIELQFLDLGYNVCTICGENQCLPLDVSHIIARKETKENGKSKQVCDLDNMEIIGRRHHQNKDGLDLQFIKDN